ncbi:LacI family DNA-binding transcriptional regulator [Kineosporia sp. J2-2]|uniref:LacI family DNA-binding transcriptional regulator n=1 Tax=Kineosporia corallincola TaxID=2835133 RepID=A0ABS5TBU0_9ACTN|nr:LacI family DNA-binding transcriptional regulator [Kineosporia corallincola]MBT0768541.1 LacI family DNA-binding transcriptional regulator [Kineosporia corallincola]
MAQDSAGTPSPARRTTIRDVAAAAGVSIATVSRILGGTYPSSPATRSRVMRAVHDLDYVVNAHARALSGATSKSIAIVLNSVVSPYYAHVAQGVQTEAAQRDRLCLIGTTGGSAERELATVRLMRQESADAVILVGNVIADDSYRSRMAEYAHALAASGSRLVLCGRPPLGPDVPAVVVEFDNTGGAHAVTSHLLSAGHRRILYVGHRPGYSTSEGRITGYRDALAAFGVPHDPALELDTASLARADGYRVMKRYLAGSTDFTAVFGANDQIAAGVRQALVEKGLRVPDDVSLVGYDDLPPAEDLGLTTVHVPHEELGRTAVRLALERESDDPAEPGHVVLGTHIVVRDSVRRI